MDFRQTKFGGRLGYGIRIWLVGMLTKMASSSLAGCRLLSVLLLLSALTAGPSTRNALANYPKTSTRCLFAFKHRFKHFTSFQAYYTVPEWPEMTYNVSNFYLSTLLATARYAKSFLVRRRKRPLCLLTYSATMHDFATR